MIVATIIFPFTDFRMQKLKAVKNKNYKFIIFAEKFYNHFLFVHSIFILFFTYTHLEISLKEFFHPHNLFAVHNDDLYLISSRDSERRKK